MKPFNRRERAGAVIFAVGVIAFFALIFTRLMTPTLFYASVFTIAIGCLLGGGVITVGGDD